MRTLYRPDDLGASANDPRRCCRSAQLRIAGAAGRELQARLHAGPGRQDVYGERGHRPTCSKPKAATSTRQATATGGFPRAACSLSPDTGDDAGAGAGARARALLPAAPLPRSVPSTRSTPRLSSPTTPTTCWCVETRDALGQHRSTRRQRLPRAAAAADDRPQRQPLRGRVRRAGHGGRHGGDGQSQSKTVEATRWTASTPTWPRPTCSRTWPTRLPIRTPSCSEATTRLVYDLFAYQRTTSRGRSRSRRSSYTLARETHDADLDAGELTKVQHSFAYSDGFGREIQKKIQAEPQARSTRQGGRRMTSARAGWAAAGRCSTTRASRSGSTSRSSPTPTASSSMSRIGVSPILFYDPVERVVATLHPNHTWEKVVFDPVAAGDLGCQRHGADRRSGRRSRRGRLLRAACRQTTTCRPGTPSAAAARSDHTSRRPRERPRSTPTRRPSPTRLARPHLPHRRPQQVRAQGDTPVEASPKSSRTRVVLDIEGNQREVIDAQDRVVMRYDYDMLGNRIHPAEHGGRRALDAERRRGQPIRAWDAGDTSSAPSTTNCAGRCASSCAGPMRTNQTRGPEREVLFGKIEYGEGQADDVALEPAHAGVQELRWRRCGHQRSVRLQGQSAARQPAVGGGLQRYTGLGRCRGPGSATIYEQHDL